MYTFQKPDALTGLPSILFRFVCLLQFLILYFFIVYFIFYVFFFCSYVPIWWLYSRRASNEIHSLNFNYDSFEFGSCGCWNCNRHTLMCCSNFNSHLSPYALRNMHHTLTTMYSYSSVLNACVSVCVCV